jgi:hypothetical protein
MANQFLGLSLFIMLLSFFIIINALSSFESEKSKTVLDSLSEAFSVKKQEILSAPGEIPSIEASIHEGSVLDQLESYFTAQIVGVTVKQDRTGSEMHVRMPFENFKNALALALEPQSTEPAAGSANRGLKPMLNSLMDTQNAIPYRMDMILGSSLAPERLVAEKPQLYKTMSRDIAAVAARLESAGMPLKFMSVGIGTGEEGMLDLYFRRHEGFSLPQAKTEGAER